MENPVSEIQETTNQQVQQPQPIQPSQNKRSISSKWMLISIVGILLLIIVLGGAYFLGIISNQQSSQQVAQQEVVKPTPISAPDETANWKTYINTKLGYSLKYPPDWGLRECPKDCDGGEGTQLLSPDISNVRGDVGGYLKHYSIGIDKQQFEFPTEEFSITEEVINNMTVTRHLEGGKGGIGGEFVVFKENNKRIVLNFTPYTTDFPDPLEDKFYAVFNQVLSTFEFIQ